MMNNPEYIYIWVNPEAVSIAICSCQKTNKDALKVPTGRNCELCSSMLFEELRKTELVKFDKRTYRLCGTVNPSKKVAEFNIVENLNTKCHKMRQANV